MSKIQNNANNARRAHEAVRAQAAARIASGKQLNKASDGAAELAIAAKLQSTSRSLAAGTSNARRALALGQTADGSLMQIQSEVTRIKELAVQASSDAFDDSDRAKAQAEVNTRIQTISDIVDRGRFGDTVLLDGSGGANNDGSFQFQVAEKAGDLATLDLSAKFDAATLGVATVDISSVSAAQTAIGNTDAAIGLINEGRSKIGAFMAGMESTISVNQAKQENLDEAVDVFAEADIAAEAAKLTQAEIKAQLAQSMITKANEADRGVTNLIR